MENKFSFLYHSRSKGAKVPIPKDLSRWPDEWHTIYHKEYPRLPKVVLENPDSFKLRGDLFKMLLSRTSCRSFSNESVTNGELSVVLKYAAGKQIETTPGIFKRMYPSAGSRYPIETYALVQKSAKGLTAGLYHYDVEHHQLDTLLDENSFSSLPPVFDKGRWYAKASVVLFFTAVFWRSQHKYGERAYRLILLEAGHVSQNVHLVAEALGLKTCAIEGAVDARDERLEWLIDIDGVAESLVGTMTLGK